MKDKYGSKSMEEKQVREQDALASLLQRKWTIASSNHSEL